jgi:hypothetical protein
MTPPDRPRDGGAGPRGRRPRRSRTRALPRWPCAAGEVVAVRHGPRSRLWSGRRRFTRDEVDVGGELSSSPPSLHADHGEAGGGPSSAAALYRRRRSSSARRQAARGESARRGSSVVTVRSSPRMSRHRCEKLAVLERRIPAFGSVEARTLCSSSVSSSSASHCRMVSGSEPRQQRGPAPPACRPGTGRAPSFARRWSAPG